jgi:hypothetical protein
VQVKTPTNDLEVVSARTKDLHICEELMFDSALGDDLNVVGHLTRMSSHNDYLEIKYVGNHAFHIALKTPGNFSMFIKRIAAANLIEE